MTKNVIAIVSVLKPVDDTRNFEKVARSISNTNKYEVNIIGFSTKKIPVETNINFHPVFNFRRTSIIRFAASSVVFKKMLKVKPELIIVTCAELLAVSIAYKILFGCKIIYDIQENYYRNIIYTSVYPRVLRYPLALIIRAVEVLTYPFIDCYILAEKIYADQLKFTSKKSVIIDNKALIPEAVQNLRIRKSEALTFVYTGTIAEHYGIFEAINFVTQLKSSIDQVKLIIIGHAPIRKIYDKIKEIAANYTYINIIGGDFLIPHDQILIEMKKADFCLMPYQDNKSTLGRIPTKLYECLCMEKPVIISPNPFWDSIIEANNAGITYDFAAGLPFDIQKLHLQYFGKNLSHQYNWKNSSVILLEMVDDLI